MRSTAIHVIDVVKIYPSNIYVGGGTSFNVEDREVLSLIVSNGSGETTTLRIFDNNT